MDAGHLQRDAVAVNHGWSLGLACLGASAQSRNERHKFKHGDAQRSSPEKPLAEMRLRKCAHGSLEPLAGQRVRLHRARQLLHGEEESVGRLCHGLLLRRHVLQVRTHAALLERDDAIAQFERILEASRVAQHLNVAGRHHARHSRRQKGGADHVDHLSKQKQRDAVCSLLCHTIVGQEVSSTAPPTATARSCHIELVAC